MKQKSMPRITAHRGASGNAPENTIAAIELAAAEGAEWIEVDVNVSSDGIPVLHHDDDLDRCTDGQGLVIELSMAELAQLDTGSWFSKRYRGERIATLDDCLNLCESLNLGINLEIKPCSGWEIPTTDQIAAVLHRRHTLPNMVISSFSHAALLRAAEKIEFIPRASLFLVAPPDWQQLTEEVSAINLHLQDNTLLEKSTIDEFHRAGLGVYCYTVNTIEDAQVLFAQGVDGVFSNYPKLLIDAGLD
ncbi:hypothetical protein AB833_11750 [Chromatiales bacterium (ex Bugula neritina AB1)]|nr:hypothetical protein AB833_11750 [Chromatiales bacterium (ex Bugula neritina AB1)]